VAITLPSAPSSVTGDESSASIQVNSTASPPTLAATDDNTSSTSAPGVRSASASRIRPIAPRVPVRNWPDQVAPSAAFTSPGSARPTASDRSSSPRVRSSRAASAWAPSGRPSQVCVSSSVDGYSRSTGTTRISPSCSRGSNRYAGLGPEVAGA
jgi:hypothetical protein